jgi:hypothetical protein
MSTVSDPAKFIASTKALLPLLKDGTYTIEEFGRDRMLIFGDLPSIASGYVSSRLVVNHAPTKTSFRNCNVTHEHYVTRTTTCRRIAELYLEDKLTDDLLEMIVDEGRKVHYVTMQENIDLRPYQQSPKYPTWQEQYAAAGITLVPDPGLFGNKTYYYIIDDIPYADKHLAAKAHGVGVSTVVNRARNQNQKFVGWTEHKY